MLRPSPPRGEGRKTPMKKGPLIIVSGPSGCGKSTLVQHVLAEGNLPLRASVSATTRARREGEVEDVSYHFWDEARFDAEVQAGGFLEWCEVHGRRYGTLRREVEETRNRDIGVLLTIDVQGAANVRQRCPDAFSIFVMTPSLEELERRLRSRSTESEATVALRLSNARQELARAGEYDYVLVNDDLGRAVAELRGVLERRFV
jgi:guanylate kinase